MTRRQRQPAGPVHRIVRELMGVSVTACGLEGMISRDQEMGPGRPGDFESKEDFRATTYVAEVTCTKCKGVKL